MCSAPCAASARTSCAACVGVIAALSAGSAASEAPAGAARRPCSWSITAAARYQHTARQLGCWLTSSPPPHCPGLAAYSGMAATATLAACAARQGGCCERLHGPPGTHGPVRARSGAAMQLAGPCAGSRAAAGHLPASLFTGSKPPTRVPNQSAALGRSSAPHKPQSRQSMSSIQARRRSEAIAAAGVRSGIISWAARCRRGHGGRPGTPEHAKAHQTHHERSPVSAGSCGPAWRPTLSHAKPSGSPVQACGRPASQLGDSTENLGSISAPKSGTCPPGP